MVADIDRVEGRLSRPLFQNVKVILSLFRPHQYIKNGFVFVGPLFSHKWSLEILSDALLVFFSFSMMASAVYILNDIKDVGVDSRHPIKKNRPLPSQQLSILSAKWLMTFVATVSLTLACLVGKEIVFFLLGYFFLNLVYSYRLKHIVILDVFIISSGFMLRILAGTAGLGIEPSQWLLLCGLMITLFLGFSKRRAELLMAKEIEDNEYLFRRVLDDYSPQMLEQLIAITAACAIITYGLYTVSPSTIETHGNSDLVYTLPFVIYGIFRYLFLLHHRERGSDTAKDLMTDKHLIITVFSWVCVTLWVLA